MHPVSIAVRRSLEWIDTDAAGIWHFSAALRMIEYAETELHRRLGIADRTVGRSPRVRIELDYLAPVRFAEEVVTTLTVTRIGRSSLTYEAVLEGPNGTVARGSLTTVLIGDADGHAVTIPGAVRAALAGEVAPTSQ